MLPNLFESLALVVRHLALRLTFPKFFRHDPPDFVAPPFSQILATCPATHPATIFYPPHFDPDKPSLIYHHGAGSTHPTRDFKIIFDQDFTRHFNIFIVWAAFHHSKTDYLHHSVDSFLHHQQTFAKSVLAYDQIIKFHRAHSPKPIVATGSSMGGIVATLHAFSFGSADYYFPLVAYPNVGDIFLGPSYISAVAQPQAKLSNPSYFSRFDVPRLKPSLRKKIFPVLGRYDQIVPFLKAKKFWQSQGITPTIFPFGHFTPFFARKEIRQLILKTVFR